LQVRCNVGLSDRKVVIGRTEMIDGEGGVVWVVCVQKAESRSCRLERSWSVRNAGVTPGRSLTNTAPIACLATPSSVMQAKRAPDGLSDQKDPGHTLLYGKWVLRRGPEACNKAAEALASVGQWIDYEASYSHNGSQRPRASSLSDIVVLLGYSHESRQQTHYCQCSRMSSAIATLHKDRLESDLNGWAGTPRLPWACIHNAKKGAARSRAQV
jgi:hypothetical protein